MRLRNVVLLACVTLLCASGQCLAQGTECSGWIFTRKWKREHPCGASCGVHWHSWSGGANLACETNPPKCVETYWPGGIPTRHLGKTQGQKETCWARIKYTCNPNCVLHNCGSQTIICCEGDYTGSLEESGSDFVDC
jgi:hypothetical protein